MAASDGARLREGFLDKTNTALIVWDDTAYRAKVRSQNHQEGPLNLKIRLYTRHAFSKPFRGPSV